MILMQISSAQGPVECCQAVSHAVRRICKEAQQCGVTTHIAQETPGPVEGTCRSVVLVLEGAKEAELAQRWRGSIQWVCASNFRPSHLRKNWFIGISTFTPEQATQTSNKSDGDIIFETMRSSGPGGQHVNTTESAIRATHTPTGISVKVQTERSQHANKRLALLLIAHKLEEHLAETKMQQRAQQRLQHYRVERGNPVLTFKGKQFIAC